MVGVPIKALQTTLYLFFGGRNRGILVFIYMSVLPEAFGYMFGGIFGILAIGGYSAALMITVLKLPQFLSEIWGTLPTIVQEAIRFFLGAIGSWYLESLGLRDWIMQASIRLMRLADWFLRLLS